MSHPGKNEAGKYNQTVCQEEKGKGFDEIVIVSATLPHRLPLPPSFYHIYKNNIAKEWKCRVKHAQESDYQDSDKSSALSSYEILENYVSCLCLLSCKTEIMKVLTHSIITNIK